MDLQVYMMKLFPRTGRVLLLLAFPFLAQAQNVGIGTTAPNASAALDVVSNNKGALLPRLTTAQRAAIANPATGLMVFQTDGTPGYYYNAGTPAAPSWQQLNVVGGVGDNLGNHTATQALNLGTNALTGVGSSIGTAVGLGVRADGGLNIGQNTTGNSIYLGSSAGRVNAGASNLFIGFQSGFSNTTGSNNVLVGYNSGFSNTTGSNITALGYNSGSLSSGLTNATGLGANVGLTQSNTVILGNGANVGIGTTTPGYALQVGNATTTSAFGMLQGAFGQTSYLRHSRLLFNDANFGIGAGNMSTTPTDADMYFYAYDGVDRDFRFMHVANGLSDPSAGGWTTDLIIKQGGNVGIGTITPVSRFSFGSTATNANAAAGRLAIYEATTGTNFYGLGLVQNASNNYGMGLWGGSGGATPYNGTTGALPNLYLDQNTSNVGIGTISPATRLDVNGNLRLAVRLCPVNQTTSYTLTADDVAFSIFKLQNAAFANPITLPAAAGQVEGQELTIISAATTASTISGTNTDNSAPVALVGSGASGIHAVKYVWAINSSGIGAWFRVQ